MGVKKTVKAVLLFTFAIKIFCFSALSFPFETGLDQNLFSIEQPEKEEKGTFDPTKSMLQTVSFPGFSSTPSTPSTPSVPPPPTKANFSSSGPSTPKNLEKHLDPEFSPENLEKFDEEEREKKFKNNQVVTKPPIPQKILPEKTERDNEGDNEEDPKSNISEKKVCPPKKNKKFKEEAEETN